MLIPGEEMTFDVPEDTLLEGQQFLIQPHPGAKPVSNVTGWITPAIRRVIGGKLTGKKDPKTVQTVAGQEHADPYTTLKPPQTKEEEKEGGGRREGRRKRGERRKEKREGWERRRGERRGKPR